MWDTFGPKIQYNTHKIWPWQFKFPKWYHIWKYVNNCKQETIFWKLSKWPVYGSFQILWEKVFSCTFFFIFECSDDLNCLDSKDVQFPILLIHYSSLSTDFVCFSKVTWLYKGVHINTAFLRCILSGAGLEGDMHPRCCNILNKINNHFNRKGCSQLNIHFNIFAWLAYKYIFLRCILSGAGLEGDMHPWCCNILNNHFNGKGCSQLNIHFKIFAGCYHASQKSQHGQIPKISDTQPTFPILQEIM